MLASRDRISGPSRAGAAGALTQAHMVRSSASMVSGVRPETSFRSRLPAWRSPSGSGVPAATQTMAAWCQTPRGTPSRSSADASDSPSFSRTARSWAPRAAPVRLPHRRRSLS